MWNWRRDRQPCSRHWSGDRNWSCYRRLNVEVPALIFVHLTVVTTFLFSSDLMVRFGAKADGAIGVKRHRSPSFAPWFQAYENPMDRGRGLGGAALAPL